MKRFFYCAAFVACFFFETNSTFAVTSVTDLRCENIENPQGIDAAQPRLSWILNSNERGQRQSAYEILIASSEKNLAGDKGDLWDSEKIDSDETVQVSYAGEKLKSSRQIFWKVRVWDANGNVSKWSHAATWTMAFCKIQIGRQNGSPLRTRTSRPSFYAANLS